MVRAFDIGPQDVKLVFVARGATDGASAQDEVSQVLLAAGMDHVRLSDGADWQSETVHLREEPARIRGARGGERRSESTLHVEAGDRTLFDALRGWRAQLAREQNVPAYVIFHDRTLRDIAQLRPASLGELARVGGIGGSKLGRYGESVLEVIREAG